MLAALPVGVLAGTAARLVSGVLVAVTVMPWPLSFFPGLLLLALALSARGLHVLARPDVAEVRAFVAVAGLFSLAALA